MSNLPLVSGPHVIIQCPDCRGSGRSGVAFDKCPACKGLTVVRVLISDLTIVQAWEDDMDSDPTH